jgi:hypothetical protein
VQRWRSKPRDALRAGYLVVTRLTAVEEKNWPTRTIAGGAERNRKWRLLHAWRTVICPFDDWSRDADIVCCETPSRDR